jgi:signal transduction histidine kinase
VQNKTLPPEELTYIFDLLGRDVDAATNMLNNLLGWSKAQLHGASLHLQAVNLHQVAEENLKIAAAQAALKQIQISNDIPGQLLAFTDKERLHFVLRNLIMNALKFTYPGGHIQLQGREKAGKVEIRVQDNGKGISPDHMARLFSQERFTTPGTAHEKGTGLGLRLSREFIQMLNGELTVESRPGQGSVFRIILPLAETPAGAWQAAGLPLA